MARNRIKITGKVTVRREVRATIRRTVTGGYLGSPYLGSGPISSTDIDWLWDVTPTFGGEANDNTRVTIRDRTDPRVVLMIKAPAGAISTPEDETIFRTEVFEIARGFAAEQDHGQTMFQWDMTADPTLTSIEYKTLT